MNDPYFILGISSSATDDEVKNAYRSLIRDYAGNDDKVGELTRAYDEIMNLRRGGAEQKLSPEYIEVRHQIQSGNYAAADDMLNAMNDSSAEWQFLKGSVCYGKGWLDDAYSYFEKAVRAEPANPEYTSAYKRMSESRNGYMRGNPNESTDGRSYRPSCCGLCQGMICADCCCECVGADCIPCC